MQDKDYSDIINEPWPQKSDRPRMRLEDRAKIFLPFAALKGFEEEIEKRQLASVKKADGNEADDCDDNIDKKVNPLLLKTIR